VDKVRIGVIGVGGMGSGHVEAIRKIEAAELTAVCDIDEPTCKAKSEEASVPGFTEHTKLLDSGLVDAITIATPHYFHPPIAIDAFARGLHVLSEKPIAVQVSEADRMIAAAKASGRKFQIMFQERTRAVHIAAKKLIDEGALGEIYRTLMVMGWYRSQAYYDSGGWRATWTGEGGGVLINQAPHSLDIFSWLAGLPCKIDAEVRTRLHDIEVEDEAFARLTSPTGAHGYLYASTTEAPGTDILEICGDKGKLHIQNGKLRFWKVEPPISEHCRTATEMWGGPKTEEVEVEIPEVETGHRAVIANFVDAILNDAPLVAPGEQGINSMELINGILLSGHRERPVDVPVNRADYDALIKELQTASKGKTRLREQRVTDPAHQK